MLGDAAIVLILFLKTVSALHPIFNDIDKKQMPNPHPGEPLRVHFGFYIESLGNFRSTEMTFDVDMYLYMSWRDPAMTHNRSDYVLVSDKAILDKMWLPGLYFANARTAYFHEVTVHNFNMFIAPDGTIAYGTRVTLNVACNLILWDYPLDRQACGIKILSYAHVKNEMNVTWFNDGPIRFNKQINLPEFHITALEHDYCDGVFHYTITENSSRLGDFSCLQGVLKLQRAIGFHLVQSYIPTGLIVAISWVSFWIDRRAVPARVSLSFTTLLTLSTQGNGIRYALPPVSYAKAIDYFYGVCMLFIFGVLLEFALVNSFMRRANKYSHMAERLQATGYASSYGALRRAHCKRDVERVQSEMDAKIGSLGTTFATKIHDGGEFDSDLDEGKQCNGGAYYGHVKKSAAHLMYEALRYSRRALAVDQLSRILFPMTFALFNAIYWLYYLNRPETEALY